MTGVTERDTFSLEDREAAHEPEGGRLSPCNQRPEGLENAGNGQLVSDPPPSVPLSLNSKFGHNSTQLLDAGPLHYASCGSEQAQRRMDEHLDYCLGVSKRETIALSVVCATFILRTIVIAAVIAVCTLRRRQQAKAEDILQTYGLLLFSLRRRTRKPVGLNSPTGF